ncbi:MAG: UDP-glucose 4-epimerase GalE [Thermodesulfovibrionales bacterium]|nr:UDP-glucose 4-epimerase GalE [Thermodesulfovibrionales bacterium]
MILIVGGAGYIGSHVNKFFSLRGYRTVVFDNLVYGHREFVKWGEFFFGDLADKEQIRRCFREYAIDAVMHFSAFAYVGESVADPAKYYLNNVANTLNLLEVMREFQVRHFIFSSTCATYGIPGTVPIPEDHPQKPVNPYGRSKLMIEEILKDYDSAYGIKHINLRYFNAAGADPDTEIGEQHDPETHLIPLAIDAALGRREDIRIFGTDYPTKDGTCIRDYIHVMDLADVHIKALEYVKDGETSDSFNLGNGTGHSVREVIDTVKRISSRDFRVIETERRAGDPPVLIGSSQKAIATLGWRPQFADIGTIVETALRWHSKKRR